MTATIRAQPRGSIARSRWAATREALAETANRFADLLGGVREPSSRAVGHWVIGDVAAHVHEVTVLNSLFALGAEPPDAWRDIYDKATIVDLNGVAALNALALEVVTERSPEVLAPLIRRQVGELLDGTVGADESQQVVWLGGIRVPLIAVLGHTLSELFVHGTDIAGAEDRSFPLPQSQARLIFESFLLELLRSPDVTRFAGGRSTGARPVSCELRLRGAAPALLVLDQDGVAVQRTARRRVDVHVSADPAVMWLMMCRRISPVRAFRSGGVVVWGRRAWRLRRLVQALQTP